MRHNFDQAIWTRSEMIDVTDALYLRAQLLVEKNQHMKALTNPIYIR